MNKEMKLPFMSHRGGHRVWARKFTEEEMRSSDLDLFQISFMHFHNSTHDSADRVLETYNNQISHEAKIKKSRDNGEISEFSAGQLLDLSGTLMKDMEDFLRQRKEELDNDMLYLPEENRHSHDF